jgi:hypothetical protein
MNCSSAFEKKSFNICSFLACHNKKYSFTFSNIVGVFKMENIAMVIVSFKMDAFLRVEMVMFTIVFG